MTAFRSLAFKLLVPEDLGDEEYWELQQYFQEWIDDQYEGA
jgi:hypothetical protein